MDESHCLFQAKTFLFLFTSSPSPSLSQKKKKKSVSNTAVAYIYNVRWERKKRFMRFSVPLTEGVGWVLFPLSSFITGQLNTSACLKA